MITFDIHHILAVVRYREPCDPDAVLGVLRGAGLTVLEVTAGTPGALEPVGRAAKAGVPIGAGTILRREEATAFARAGAAFPRIPFVPTGGIGIEDIPTWPDAGAACVGLGSGLLGSEPPRSDRDFAALGERARRAVELAGTLT